jgi:hypothetical protein
VAKYSRASILASLALSCCLSWVSWIKLSPGWVPKKKRASLLRSETDCTAAAAFYMADERYFTCQDPQQTTRNSMAVLPSREFVESISH